MNNGMRTTRWYCSNTPLLAAGWFILKRIKFILAFVGFFGFSGLGWLFDMCVYMLLVSAVSMDLGFANLFGGICGASFAFIMANHYIFFGSKARLPRKLAFYVAYQIVLISAASIAVEFVYSGLNYGVDIFLPNIQISRELTAFAAKCLITPATLIANFFVARSLVEIMD